MNTRKTGSRRILAADIGGTHARFSAIDVNDSGESVCGELFKINTALKGIRTFGDFWRHFLSKAPPALTQVGDYDAVSLAVAGAVQGATAILSNIDWNINEEDHKGFKRLFLLNDFLAQGYALTDSQVRAGMQTVRAGTQENTGSIALVGAGTGLGHCALHHSPVNEALDRRQKWLVTGSESGHGSFAFRGEQEKALEQHMIEATGKRWLSNDDVVSGSGVVRLHKALTGKTTSPADALHRSNDATVNLFARFYARACRNFCLSILPVQTLIISGGIASKNPHVVSAPEFSREFNNAHDYEPIMRGIPIALNSSDDLGLLGSARYAWEMLNRI
jgi:glucokinase